MPNPAKLLALPGTTIDERPLVPGYVSTARAAPAAFGDPVWVILPEHSTEAPVACSWSAEYGTSLPAQGARVVVGFPGGEADVPVVLWWEGVWSDSDSGWIEPALLNSWANQAGRLTVAYRKKANEVRLRGSLWGGASGSSPFTLPNGFRPTGTTFDSSGGYTTQASATAITVSAAGVVTVYFASGATQASIDGVTFTTD